MGGIIDQGIIDALWYFQEVKTMKKFLSILLSAAICFSAAVIPAANAVQISPPSDISDNTDKGEGGVIFEDMGWDLSGGTLTYYGSTKMPNWPEEALVPWYELRSQINNIVVQDGVKSLGAYVFYGCSNATSIRIPSNITDVATNCLAGTGISTISLPSTVTMIGAEAFNNCRNLRDIYIYSKDCVFYGKGATICNSSTDRYNASFNGTIHGYSGSTAEEYAKKYNYKFSVINGSEPIQTTVSRVTT